MSSGGAKTTAVEETVAVEMFKGGGGTPDSLADVSEVADRVVAPGRRAVAGAGAEGFGFCPALLGAKASAADHPASFKRVCEGCGKRGANGWTGSIFCL